MFKIMILSGGWTEKFASLKSGKKIAGLIEKYADDLFDAKPHIVNVDPYDTCLFESVKKNQPDVIVNLVHGYCGEDGGIQVWLDTMGVHYTGPKHYDGFMSMNKHMMRLVAESIKIPLAQGSVLNKAGYVSKKHMYPHIIKPLYGGSSNGIHVVHNYSEQSHIEIDYDVVLLEEFMNGPELSVVIKDGKCLASMLITHDDEIYTIHAKKTDIGVQFQNSDSFSDQNIITQAKKYAAKLYKAIKGHGIARIDFKLSDKPYFIDYNAIPGMVLVPRAMAMHGHSELDFLKHVIDYDILIKNSNTDIKMKLKINTQSKSTAIKS